MELIDNKITIERIIEMSKKMHGGLVKAVVDVEKKIMVIDAPMHADEEQYLLEIIGSDQKNLWGVNLHPKHIGKPEWIEFDSMINTRPSWGNSSRGVDDVKIQEKIIQIINKLVII